MNNMFKSVVLAGVIVFGGIIAGDYLYDKVSNEQLPSMIATLEPAAGPADIAETAETSIEEDNNTEVADVQEIESEVIETESDTMVDDDVVTETAETESGTMDDVASETMALSNDVTDEMHDMANEMNDLIQNAIDIEPAAGDEEGFYEDEMPSIQ